MKLISNLISHLIIRSPDFDKCVARLRKLVCQPSLLSDAATFDALLSAFLAAHDMDAIRTEMSADLQSSSSPAAGHGKNKNSKSATLRLPLFHHQQHKERKKKKDKSSDVGDGDRAASPAAAKSKSAILKTIKKLGSVAGKKKTKSKSPTGDQ